MLASLLVIAWNVIEITPIEFLVGGLNIGKVYFVLEDVVCAICLIAFAIMGAWLVARKRRGPRQSLPNTSTRMG